LTTFVSSPPLSATGVASGTGIVAESPPLPAIQPAATAIQKKAPTTVPPRSADPKGERKMRRALLICRPTVGEALQRFLNGLQRKAKFRSGQMMFECALVAAGQLASLRFGIRSPHQGAADQHRVDSDALQLLQLGARGDAALGDDRLARGHVGHQ